VHYAGISVRGRTISERKVKVADFEKHLVDWPGEDPADAIEVAERRSRRRAGR
jgi:hypothetical protein